MHISLAPEILFSLGKIQITNSLFTGLIIVTITCLFVLLLSGFYSVKRPSKLQLALEGLLEFTSKTSSEIIGSNSTKISSFLLTFLLFIGLANFFGLLPFVHSIGFVQPESLEHSAVDIRGCITTKECYIAKDGVALSSHFKPLFRAPSSDVSFTISLALISILSTNFLGFKKLGLSYAKKYIDFSSAMNFVVGVMELISEVGKIISFSFRLFGNIFAGEVLLLVITSITFGIATLPFLALEVFVSLIQAFVFFVLTSVFISLAIENH